MWDRLQIRKAEETVTLVNRTSRHQRDPARAGRPHRRHAGGARATIPANFKELQSAVDAGRMQDLDAKGDGQAGAVGVRRRTGPGDRDGGAAGRQAGGKQRARAAGAPRGRPASRDRSPVRRRRRALPAGSRERRVRRPGGAAGQYGGAGSSQRGGQGGTGQQATDAAPRSGRRGAERYRAGGTAASRGQGAPGRARAAVRQAPAAGRRCPRRVQPHPRHLLDTLARRRYGGEPGGVTGDATQLRARTQRAAPDRGRMPDRVPGSGRRRSRRSRARSVPRERAGSAARNSTTMTTRARRASGATGAR